MELYQNTIGYGFLKRRPSCRYCCYGNYAAGSKPI